MNQAIVHGFTYISAGSICYQLCSRITTGVADVFAPITIGAASLTAYDHSNQQELH
jgi:hypothetical protein